MNPLTEYREHRGLTLEGLAAMFTPPVHKSTIMRWETDGVPLSRVLDVERVTGIPRKELRPDVFS